ncbi:phage portal protein [Streptomyces sp. WMMC897]|uniref:phage portal protein n=1 Tax=Streptomyces sp. WMMC897 TaxID=3014782 RepID=UPI0022B67ACB|nr:phage portal protein [Streptomyces sp. WMMC897]MCZ7413071.1 phage portal protein [Streptomyces sp. WMMC897]MCZ7415457.1 phage portal protein [Streptomyces sp. WMMC897]
MGRALAAPLRALGAVSKRAITALPWAAGGPRPGVVQAERAVSLVPVWACVRILADSVASLPVQLYRRNGADRVRLSYIPQLLFAPAARDDLFQWLHKAVYSLALRGNAYGLVVRRDDFGFPTMIEWLHPDDVWVDELRPTMPVFYWMGVEVPREDIVHIPWMVPPGRVVGLSPVAAFAHTIGVGLAATEYGRAWFDNGGTPPATMKNTQKTINPAESAEIRDRLMASIRSGKPLVYGADWDFNALQVSPEESQFIETMRLNATQIAAIYGVAPEMVGGESGGTMTYANVEQQAINFVNFTLRPWLVRLESVLSRLMPGREFVRFNADALIRADTLSRYQAHNLALSGQWKTPNEVRATEDMAPVPWGDDPNPVPGAAPEPAATDDPEEEGSPR